MLHTTYKLSEALNDEAVLNNAARIVAEYCYRGAVENQHNNDLTADYDALSVWGFSEIMDCYLEHVFIRHDDMNPVIADVEPQTLGWYDELELDCERDSDGSRRKYSNGKQIKKIK